MFRLTTLLVLSFILSTTALADGHRHGHHHGHHHDHYRHRHYGHGYYAPPRYYREEIVYMPAPQPYYAPPPPVRYRYYDQRSPQGLVGGMLGSAAGYEMGRGDPLAAGIGAAAGSWIGNGMYR